MSSILKRPNGKWRARYRDDAGKEHARHFARKTDADRWLKEIAASQVTGMYVDPGAGKETLRVFAERWRAGQLHRPRTREQIEIVLRRHIYPTLGERRLATILASDVQALVSSWAATASPATVETRYRVLATILRAAVTDKKIAESPCVRVSLPKKAAKSSLVPIDTSTMLAIRDAMPDRYRALVTLAAGTGMRRGEVLGLTVDRVDFLRRRVTVNRQLGPGSGRVVTFTEPKTEASNRVIPLPDAVLTALAEHLQEYGEHESGLIFTTAFGGPVRPSALWMAWSDAQAKAGVSGVKFHDLRHYYASVLIRAGESVKVVQARLGHKTATETLDTYAALFPDDEDRSRIAVDNAFRAAGADYLRTGEGVVN